MHGGSIFGKVPAGGLPVRTSRRGPIRVRKQRFRVEDALGLIMARHSAPEDEAEFIRNLEKRYDHLIRRYERSGFQHVVMVSGLGEETDEWLKRHVGSSRANYVAFAWGRYMFRDPDHAFAFKMRWG